MEFTVAAIETLTGVLQPNISRSEVVDEWKLLQVDSDLPTYDKQEIIEKYWNRVFQLQSHEGELRYKVLPTIVKSTLIFVLCSSQTRLRPLPVQTQGTQPLKVFIQLYYNNSHQQYENRVSHSSMFKITML